LARIQYIIPIWQINQWRNASWTLWPCVGNHQMNEYTKIWRMIK
jgi:hypothetical protein